MTNRQTISVVSFSNLEVDPRVYRQIKVLQEHFQVKAFGYGAINLSHVEFVEVRGLGGRVKSLHRGQLKGWLWAVANEGFELLKSFFGRSNLGVRLGEALDVGFHSLVPRSIDPNSVWKVLARIPRHRQMLLAIADADLVLLNDFTGLLLLPALNELGVKKVLYDAHEYTPGQKEEGATSKSEKTFVRNFLAKNLGTLDQMVTVCDGIAELYSREFQIPQPVVIMNAPFFHSTLFRDQPVGDPIRIVHHGVAARKRHLELMIESIALVGAPYELHFFLVSRYPDYYQTLQELGKKAGNVYFHEPVPMTELSERLSVFDVGMYLLPPSNLNHQLALPNKLFEFIQARLAVAIGPSPEMRKIVEQYEVGIVAEDFTPQAMAQAIRTLSPDRIRQYRRSSDAAAMAVSGERQGEILVGLVTKMLGGAS